MCNTINKARLCKKVKGTIVNLLIGHDSELSLLRRTKRSPITKMFTEGTLPKVADELGEPAIRENPETYDAL